MEKRKNRLKQIKNYLKDSILLLEKYKEQIINEEKISIFEKIIIINSLFRQFSYSKNIDDFIQKDFKYVILNKDIGKNSVFDLTNNFLKEIINNLTEESYLFFHLLEINSGQGYFKGNKFFCFNMLNINTIKQNLMEIIPEILIFFNMENIKYLE